MKEVSTHLVGDRSVLVRFGNEISPLHLNRIRSFLAALSAPGGMGDVLTQIQPAYASVLLSFNPLLHHPERVREKAQELALKNQNAAPMKSRELEIPVTYGGAAGPDLPFVAEHSGLTEAQVIDLHSSATYLVYFLGFMPGFAYLGGLPQELSTPRLPSARLKVPAGSVGLAGLQTGVYPVTCPGGWRLIGRTDTVVFDRQRNPMALFEIGDQVRFKRARS